MTELTENQAPAHRIKVQMGYTRNIGNFESVRMDVGLEVDGRPGATPTETFDKAADWVERQFVARFNQVTQELGVK